MTVDKEISRITPKGANLKPFNDAFKSGLGYEMPEGPIVTWNDFARAFKKRLPGMDTKTHGKTESSKKVQEYAVEVFDYMSVKWYYGEKVTPMGVFVNSLNTFLQDALSDGFLGVFVRGDDQRDTSKGVPYPDDMLRGRTTNGYMLSKTEVLRALDEYVARGLADTPSQQKAAGLIYDIFETIFDSLPDHADVKMHPVNNPVPFSKIKNLSYTGGIPEYRRKVKVRVGGQTGRLMPRGIIT